MEDELLLAPRLPSTVDPLAELLFPRLEVSMSRIGVGEVEPIEVGEGSVIQRETMGKRGAYMNFDAFDGVERQAPKSPVEVIEPIVSRGTQ